MMSKKVNKQLQNNTTVLIVIIAALVFSVSAVWIKKSVDDFRDYREILSHERDVLDRYEQNLENLNSLREEAEAMAERDLPTDVVLAALPLRFQPASDLANMEFIARASGVQLRDVRANHLDDPEILPLQTISGLTPYSVNVEVNGRYNAIKAFLRNIESSKQPMLPMSVSITSLSGDTITVEIGLVLYAQGGAFDDFTEEEFIE